MPKMPFSPDNKAESVYDYPKLTLAHGEKARIVVIDKEGPDYAYVHTLRMPSIIDGQVQKEINQRTKAEEVKHEFVGRHLCLGDMETLQAKGMDPSRCPSCEVASRSDAVDEPQRRFAIHVIQYQTKQGSFTVQEPFSVKLVAWLYGDKIYNKLVDIIEEFKSLQRHDLMLGPCESAQFQTFDISVAGKAEWLASQERKIRTAQTYKENQAKDLLALIGRKLSRELIEQDLERVLLRYRMAFGGPVQVEETEDEVASALDVDALLDAAEPVPAAEPAPETETNSAEAMDVDIDSLIAEPEAAATTTEPAAEEVAEPQGEPEAEDAEDEDFDKLLEGID